MGRPRRTAAGLRVVLIGLLVTACGSEPHVDEVEPAMTRAVRTVVDGSGGAPVVRELLPVCGPTDAPEGLVLRLTAEPRGPLRAGATAALLRAQGLDVRTGSGDGEPLLTARPDGRAWRLEVARSDRTGLLVVAHADVHESSAASAPAGAAGCG